MYVAANPNEEPSASNRFRYHCFLKRHGMKVTKLAVRDNKRSNSAISSSIEHDYAELHEFLVKLRFAEKDEEHDPEKPYSPCLTWLPGMRRRVVLGDETSVHMKLDGTRRFTYASVLHEPPSRIDAPMPQFRCSVLGSRNVEGDCVMTHSHPKVRPISPLSSDPHFAVRWRWRGVLRAARFFTVGRWWSSRVLHCGANTLVPPFAL